MGAAATLPHELVGGACTGMLAAAPPVGKPRRPTAPVLGARRRVPVRSAGCCWLERCDGLSCPNLLPCGAALNRHSSPRIPCAGYAGSQKRDLSRTIRWKRFPFIVRVAHTSSSPLRWNPQLESTTAPVGRPSCLRLQLTSKRDAFGGLLDRRCRHGRWKDPGRSARGPRGEVRGSRGARAPPRGFDGHNDDDDADNGCPQTSDKPNTQPTQPQHNWNSRRVPRPAKCRFRERTCVSSRSTQKYRGARHAQTRRTAHKCLRWQRFYRSGLLCDYALYDYTCIGLLHIEGSYRAVQRGKGSALGVGASLCAWCCLPLKCSVISNESADGYQND